MASKLAENSEKGFKDAQTYEKYRPSYPVEIVDSVFELLRQAGAPEGGPLHLVDLAAGTGKLTELLASHKNDARIIAVEPHTEMREVLRVKGLNGVSVLDSRADNMDDIQPGWADGITTAQAFHWFANIEALSEIHRCLKQSGLLFLLWNYEDYISPQSIVPKTKWQNELREIVRQHDRKSSSFLSGRKWDAIFNPESPDFARVNALFALPLSSRVVEWTQWLSREALWERFRSLSFIGTLDAEALSNIQRLFNDLLDNGDAEINGREEIAVHGHTMLHWLRKS